MKRIITTILAAMTIVSIGAVPATAAPIADLSITVVSDPGQVSPPGGIALYRVAAHNAGPAIAPADVTDTTTGGTYVSSSSQIPSECTAPANGTLNPTITCFFSSIPAGTSRNIVVAIRTPASAGSVSNAASIRIPPSVAGTIVDDNDANNDASAVTPVVAAIADLSVTVVSDPGQVSPPGGIALYRVAAHNAGPAPAPADVTDTTTGGTYVSSSSQIPSECTAPANGTLNPTITCFFSSIVAGTSRNIVVAIRTPASVGSVSNAATIRIPPSAAGSIVDNNDANNDASAVTPVVAAIADLSVTVVSDPGQVSPPGGIALYRIAAHNAGPAIAPADVTDTTTGGTYVSSSSQIPSECTAPANGTLNPTITCFFSSIPAGTSRNIVVAIRTPASVGSVSNAATIRIPPSAAGSIVDNNDANNEASAVTPVVNDPTKSTALLQVGETLIFKASKLTVRTSLNGVIATVADAPAAGATCGAYLCADGVRADFSTDPYYQGTLGFVIDFGKGNPCRGLGAGSTCSDLYMRKNGVVTLVPNCVGAAGGPNCVERVEKDGPVLRWTVRLDSTDPDFLAPIRNSVGSTNT